MIKGIFLNQKTKTKTNQKEHGTYQEARNIGILYNADEFDSSDIEKLTNVLENDQKIVGKLGYIDKPQNPEQIENFLFTKKDISSTGTIKKDSISFFTKQPFDFLISLDTSGNINYKFVLAMSMANCKIGLETESYQELLLMSIKSETEKKASVDSLVKYLKMI